MAKSLTKKREDRFKELYFEEKQVDEQVVAKLNEDPSDDNKPAEEEQVQVVVKEQAQQTVEPEMDKPGQTTTEADTPEHSENESDAGEKSDAKAIVNKNTAGEDTTAGEDEGFGHYGYIPSPTETLSELPLPNGTRIKSPTGAVYTINSYITSGSYANTYIVHNAENDLLVLKEFCIREPQRLTNLHLNILEDKEYKTVLKKFKKEPDRVLNLFNQGKGTATCVTDEMTYNDAFDCARKEVGKGGVFVWNGHTYTTFTEEEQQALNLVLPRSKVFQDYGNHYYVMEHVKGNTLYEYIQQIRQRKTGRRTEEDLTLMLRIMEQLAIAVENMSNNKFVHLDLSPNNVIFKVDDEGQVKLKVIDFGFATYLEDIKANMKKDNGRPGSYIPKGCGTEGFTDSKFNDVSYMAYPTCINLIDVFSLGAILYYMTLFDVWSIKDYYEQKEMEHTLITINKMAENAMQENLHEFIFCSSENPDDMSEREKQLRKAIFELIRKAIRYDYMPMHPFEHRCQSATEFKMGIQNILNHVDWIDVTRAQVKADKDNTYLIFRSDDQWSAKVERQDTGSEEWITIKKENRKGKKGDNKILNLELKPNTTTESRKATVTVKSGIWVIQTEVEQEGVILEAPEIRFPQGASQRTDFKYQEGKSELTVIANRGWTSEISPEGYGWLTIDKKGDKEGTFIVPFRVTGNTSHQARKARIVFRCDNKPMAEWLVCQGAKPEAVIKFKPGVKESKEFPSAGGQVTVGFNANYSITESLYPEDAKNWLTTKPIPDENGWKLEITAFPNQDENPRQAEVTLHCEDKSITYRIQQKGNDKRPEVVEPAKPATISPTYLQIPDSIKPTTAVNLEFEGVAKSSKTIGFTCNTEWTIKVEQTGNWVILPHDSTSGTTRSVQLAINVEDNNTPAIRKAILRVCAGVAIQEFHITQYPKAFVEPVIPRSLILNASKETKQLYIHTSDEWFVTVSPRAKNWLSVNPMKGKAGIHQLNLTVLDNPYTTNRSTAVVIECKNDLQSVVVEQLGKKDYTRTDTDNPTAHLKKWMVAILCAVVVGAAAWFFFGQPMMPKSYTLDLPQGQTLAISHEGAHQAAFPLLANDQWSVEIAEEQPKGWLSIGQAAGDESVTSFSYTAAPNRSSTPKQATVKVVCGDISRLIRVTQDIDHAYAIEEEFVKISQDMSLLRPYLKNLSKLFTVYELDEATGKRTAIRESIDRILRGKVPGVDIGNTHHIVSFEKDSDDKIKSITLKKR